MNIKDLRYILAKTATKTPETYYYSHDLIEIYPQDNQNDIKNSLYLIGLSSLDEIEPGGQVEISINNITNKNIPKGSWKALITRNEETIQSDYPLPQINDGDQYSIREWISKNINQTPKTLIAQKSLIDNFQTKMDADGNTVSPLTQGVMMLCIACFDIVPIHEKHSIIFTILTHNAEDGGSFLVEIERQN